MKRITLRYGGMDYTLGGVDLDDLKERILGAQTSGSPTWLRVNHGEGSFRATDLLIVPGVSVAVTGVDDDGSVDRGGPVGGDSGRAPT